MNRKSLFYLLIFFTFFLNSCTRHKSITIQAENPDIITLSKEAIKLNKLKVITTQEKNYRVPIATTASIKLDENALFKANSLITGLVIQDNVNLGDAVKRGQTLATIQNPEIAKLESSYVHEFHLNEIEIEQARNKVELAEETLHREKKLFDEGITPKKDYLQAETDFKLLHTELNGKLTHRKHLNSESSALFSAYGINPQGIKSGIINSSIPITAARSGIVIKKNVSLGALVNPDTVMYEIADFSKLWLDINIYPNILEKIKIGLEVSFKSDTLPKQEFKGTINYIQQVSFNNSGTYLARAILSNSQNILKPGIVGEAFIETDKAEKKIFLNDKCIQGYGKEVFVFQKLNKNRFKKITVELGPQFNDGYIINKGLKAGMKIVSEGSFLLKAELLKSLNAAED